MRHSRLAGVAVSLLLLGSGRSEAVRPRNTMEEFLYGQFAVPGGAPKEGAAPARVAALPRERGPLPKGALLRFQHLGRGKYQGYSAQLLVHEDGSLYQVVHRGDATAESLARPAYPKRPSQKIEGEALERLRAGAARVAAGPAYRGHEGAEHAPVFFITVMKDGQPREVAYEAVSDDLVNHLRYISHFAFATPPGQKKGGRRQ